MTKTPPRGQTKSLTAAQRLKMVFDNSKWYYTLTGNDLIFITAYKVMRKDLVFTNGAKYISTDGKEILKFQSVLTKRI